MTQEESQLNSQPELMQMDVQLEENQPDTQQEENQLDMQQEDIQLDIQQNEPQPSTSANAIIAMNTLTTIQNNKMIPTDVNSIIPFSQLNNNEHPPYAMLQTRLATYDEWPIQIKQTPKQLSKAGYFYTGRADKVTCFSCGISIRNWGKRNNPWRQHIIASEKCTYLQLCKGKVYIDKIKNKYILRKSKKENISDRKTHTNKNEIRNFKVRHYQRFEKCMFCEEHPRNIAILTCGHMVSCSYCIPNFKTCHCCRSTITAIVTLYF